MSARIITTATLAIAITGVLPAKAADPQLLNLVMPDAKVLAGVNVDQAKATPFGQYVLSQMQSQNNDMQKLTDLTGFDPTRDVRELLVASTGKQGEHSGLALARGFFDPNRIAAAAVAHEGKTEVYKGVTIIEDPKQTNGFAFLDNTLVIAGDLANVRAAIDRRSAASVLPAALMVQVNQWSTSQDAWAVSMVPVSTLKPPPNAPPIPGMNGQGPFQAVQAASAGVKFGSTVVVTAQVQADTAQNAQAMGDALKLLASLAALQAQNEPQVAALAQSLQITPSGTNLNLSVSLPQDQLEQIVRPARKTPQTRRRDRRM